MSRAESLKENEKIIQQKKGQFRRLEMHTREIDSLLESTILSFQVKYVTNSLSTSGKTKVAKQKSNNMLLRPPANEAQINQEKPCPYVLFETTQRKQEIWRSCFGLMLPTILFIMFSYTLLVGGGVVLWWLRRRCKWGVGSKGFVKL